MTARVYQIAFVKAPTLEVLTAHVEPLGRLVGVRPWMQPGVWQAVVELEPRDPLAGKPLAGGLADGGLDGALADHADDGL